MEVWIKQQSHMPRLLLNAMNNSEPNLVRAAAAIEAGGLGYVIANDSFSTGQPLMVRCAVGTAVWFFYERYLGTLN